MLLPALIHISMDVLTHPVVVRPLPLCRSHSRTVSVTSKDSHSGEPRVCTFLPLR